VGKVTRGASRKENTSTGKEGGTTKREQLLALGARRRRDREKGDQETYFQGRRPHTPTSEKER